MKYQHKIGGKVNRTVSTDATAANELITLGQVEGMINRPFKTVDGAPYPFILEDKAKHILLNAENATVPTTTFAAGDLLVITGDRTGGSTITGITFGSDNYFTYASIKLNLSATIFIKFLSDSVATVWGDLSVKEQNINGTRLTTNIATTYAIDWNAASQFVLTPTAAVTLSNANLPVSPNTKVISGVFKASSFAVTFPASWKARANNDPLSATLDTHFTAETISDTVVLYTLENIPA